MNIQFSSGASNEHSTADIKLGYGRFRVLGALLSLHVPAFGQDKSLLQGLVHGCMDAHSRLATVIESATKDDKASACAKSLAVVSRVFGEASGGWAATRQ